MQFKIRITFYTNILHILCTKLIISTEEENCKIKLSQTYLPV